MNPLLHVSTSTRIAATVALLPTVVAAVVGLGLPMWLDGVARQSFERRAGVEGARGPSAPKVARHRKESRDEVGPLAARLDAMAEELQKAGQSLPIVALTAGAFDKDRARCLGAGMNGFLGKPVRLERPGNVLAEVAAGLERQAS